MSRITRSIKTLHAEQDIPVGSTSAPFMVKNKHGERGTSGVITLEFSAGVGGTTFGNTLIVDASSELCKGNITAIKDNAGNTWVQLNSITSTEPTACCLDLWMATNIAAKSPYKVEITTSQTAGAFTAEVVEYAGAFELDKLEAVNTAMTEEGFETTEAVLGEGNPVITVPTATIEKLKVGMVAGGGSIPQLEAKKAATTIVSFNAAKKEVKLSNAPTATEAGVVVFFGQAFIKAPTLTFTTGDVFFFNYSGKKTPAPAAEVLEGQPKLLQPSGATINRILPITGFNTSGIAGYFFGPGAATSTLEIPFSAPTEAGQLLPQPYSLQVATFKFAPNNRGVVGTNAVGELLGKVSATTGKMDPTIQTAIPSFVAVIAPVWTNFANAQLNEETTELTAAGSLQIRFESSATQARIRGTIKVKALQEVKEGARILTTPTNPNYHPVAEQRVLVSFGPTVTELNTTTVASINTAGETTLPKATKVKAGEIIALDGTYALT